MRSRSNPYALPPRRNDVTLELGVKSAQDTGRKFWPDERGMQVLREAAAERASVVYIDGVKYLVTYGIMFKSKVTGNSEYPCLHLKRADGKFAPRGYISHAKAGI